MENKTGRIVAMASQPDYDPNAWVGGISAKDYAALTGKGSNFPLLNRAIQGQAAPGSIFKVIPTTAAVNAGYDFNGRYPCPSSYSIGNQVFKNFESQGHGSITLGQALEVSCDTVYYALSHQQWQKDGGMKPKKNANDWFYKTAHQFGLGAETGIDLPNEVTGRVPDRKWKQDFWKDNKDYWCRIGKKGGTYVQQLSYENCLEGNLMRAGDSVNYSIGQGDTLVTPIQMATIYAAIANGGTLWNPTVGKAIISPDGKKVTEIKPKAHGKLPMDTKTQALIEEALAGVATRGTAAWRFGGWPQDKIPMHAKTGTAEVYGKQTTSWFATYTKDYAIVMTIAQGGTGSGASGPAVRNIYDALYGLDDSRQAGPQAGPAAAAAEDPPEDRGRRLHRRPEGQAVRPGGREDRPRRAPEPMRPTPTRPTRRIRARPTPTSPTSRNSRARPPPGGGTEPMTAPHGFSVSRYAPERGTLAKLAARDSVVRLPTGRSCSPRSRSPSSGRCSSGPPPAAAPSSTTATRTTSSSATCSTPASASR